MDFALILDRLRPKEDWGPLVSSGDYEKFKKTWRGESEVPTEREMMETWVELTAADPSLLLPPEEQLKLQLRRSEASTDTNTLQWMILEAMFARIANLETKVGINDGESFRDLRDRITKEFLERSELR